MNLRISALSESRRIFLNIGKWSITLIRLSNPAISFISLGTHVPILPRKAVIRSRDAPRLFRIAEMVPPRFEIGLLLTFRLCRGLELGYHIVHFVFLVLWRLLPPVVQRLHPCCSHRFALFWWEHVNPCSKTTVRS